MKNRYYIQHLTEQIFIVREYLSTNGTPQADDRIVRSFNILHDAHLYINSMNEAQHSSQNSIAPEEDTSPEPPRTGTQKRPKTRIPGTNITHGYMKTSGQGQGQEPPKRPFERQNLPRKTPPHFQKEHQTILPATASTIRNTHQDKPHPMT